MSRRPRSNLLSRAVGLLFWLALMAAAVAGLSVVGGRLLFDRVDEEIRSRAVALLQPLCPRLRISLGSAHRLEGVGLVLKRLALTEPGAAEPLVRVDELLLSCTTDLRELALRELQVRSIQMRGLRIAARRRPRGDWGLLEHFDLGTLLPSGASAPPIPVQVEHGELSLHGCDGGGAGEPAAAAVELRDIQGELLPHYPQDGAAPTWRFQGTLRGDHFTRARFEGGLDPADGAWTLSASADRLRLDAQLMRQLAGCGAAVDLAGGARGELHDVQAVLWSAPGRPVRHRVSGRLAEGRWSHPRLPEPIAQLEGQFHCDSRQLLLTDVRGVVSGAQLQLDRLAWHWESQVLELSAGVRQLRVDQRLKQSLPPAWQACWDQLEPRGTVQTASWHFAGSLNGQVARNELDIRCQDASFRYVEMPYRFRRAEGWLRLRDDLLTIDLQAPVSGQPVKISGQIRQPGGPAHGWVEVATTEGAVPLDEEMISALEPAMQQTVRSFSPRGMLRVGARYQRSPAGEDHSHVVVRVDNGAVDYAEFPYPVDRIHGTLTMVDDRWTYDLQGRNDSAVIQCDGSWDPRPADGRHLRLRFRCDNLPLEDELRHALSVDLQRLWSSLEPRGVIDEVQIDLAVNAVTQDSQLEVLVRKHPPQRPDGEGRSVWLRPRWLPYRLDNVTGVAHYQNGLLRLHEVRAEHGLSAVQADGVCRLGADSWQLSLSRLVADNLSVDRELAAALPGALAGSIERLRLRGPLDLDGQLQLNGPLGRLDRDSALSSAAWNLALDFEEGSLDCGLAIDKIRGGLQLKGSYDGRRTASQGELAIDSLELQGVPLTEVRGPLWIDSGSIRLGSWADSQGRPRQLQARALGGTINSDAVVMLDEEGRFEVNAALSGGELRAISSALVPLGGQVAGRTNVVARVSGSGRGTHTLRGEGMLQLREAEIYEVPVIVALLRMLSVQPQERSFFSHGDIDFRIEGDRMYLDRINLDGGPVSLKGSGELNLQRQINLNFYTRVGRDAPKQVSLPLAPIRPLFREASRNILQIDVTGTVDNPQVARRAFPELNDTLQRLFPDAARRRETPVVPLLGGRLRRLR